MKLAKTFGFAATLALALVAVSGTHAEAQRQIPRFEEQETVRGTVVRGALSDHHLTFSGPVAIPGVSLAAGTYVFRFPVQSAANVIQVLSEDRSIIYAMFMTMPTMRDEATEQHEVLWEARTDAPPAIKAWFLPDRTTGHELIYPTGVGQGEQPGGDEVTETIGTDSLPELP